MSEAVLAAADAGLTVLQLPELERLRRRGLVSGTGQRKGYRLLANAV